LHLVLEQAETDEKGRRIIYVPRTGDTIRNIKKALIYLWNRQHSRDAPWPNPAPHPGNDKILKDAIEKYSVDLVYDAAVPGSSRKGTCSLRDPYSDAIFMRMLCYLWRNLPIKSSRRGARAYSSENRYPYHRERLCLLARHHMLMRDEDIRRLSLSDLFCIQSRHPAAGSQSATGLVFCIRKGKTNKKGIKMYSTAFRHKNFLRCTVGGFAFYMLERWQASVHSYA
jgi:hypothetical protein